MINFDFSEEEIMSSFQDTLEHEQTHELESEPEPEPKFLPHRYPQRTFTKLGELLFVLF